jgi:hypothetical protein
VTRSRWVAGGSAIAAALLVLAVAHHAITSFVLARVIGLATGTSVHFDDVQLGATRTTFTNLHLRVGDDPLLDVQRASVAYHLRDLLPGGARAFGLVAIDLEHPVVSLVRHRDGSTNLARVLPSGGSAGPSGGPPLQLGAQVRDGEIRVLDEAPLEPDLAAQSIVAVDVTAQVDTAARTTVHASASLIGRTTQTAPLRAYPIAARSTTDVRRGFSATRVTAARIPLRGIVNWLIHAPVARFDDGTVDHVNVLAYALGASTSASPALQLGGGADLVGARIHVAALDRPIAGVSGHLDLFGDGVTTRGLRGTVAGIPLRVQGGVYDFAHLQFQIGVAGDAELAQLKVLFAFLDAQPVRGRIHLETLIAGDVADPLIRTALAGRRLFYGAIPLDGVHGIVDYHHGAVTFTGVHAGYGPLHATTSGNVDVSTPNAAIEAFVAVRGPAAQIPYAQAIAADSTIDARAVVIGTGQGGFRVGGTIAANGPGSEGSGYVSVDEHGRGEFGPFLFDHRDGTTLAGALRLERPISASAGWLDVHGFRLDIPSRLATLPGVQIPPLPQVGGILDGSVVAGGPPSDFVVAGHLHARRAGFQHYAFGEADLGLGGTLADLRLRRVRVDGPVGHFRGGGAVAGGLFALAGTYDGTLQALAPFTGQIGAQGPVQAPVLAIVDGRGITVQTADAAMAGASIHGIPIDRAAGTLRIDAAGVRIVAADADVDGHRAVAASTDHEVAISAVGLPAAALAAAGLPLRAGVVSVFGVAGFRGPTFRGSVDLTDGVALGGYPIGGWAELAVDGATLAVHDGVAGLGATYARIGGRLDHLDTAAPRYALAADIPLGNVATLAADLHLPASSAEGSFGAQLTVAGAGGAPQIAGTVDVPEASYHGLSMHDGSARLRLDVRPALRMRVDDGRAQVHGTAVTFAGDLSPTALALHVASPAVDLVDFDDYFDESGLLAGTGPVTLSFRDDGTLVRTYGRVALTGARIRHFPLGAVRADWGMRAGRIVAAFTASAPTGTLAAAGSIAPAPGPPLVAFARADYDGTLRGDDVDLGSWLPNVGLPVAVLGRLDAQAQVRGAFPRIAVGGQASVRNGQIGPYPLTAASLRTRILGDAVHIDDALVDLGFARLTSSGSVGVGPGAPLDLHVHASVPDVHTAAAKIVRGGYDVGGSLETDALVTGSLERPTIAAGFDLEAGRYGQFRVKHIIGDAESDLQQVRLDSVDIAFDRGSAEVAGSIPITLAPFALGPPTSAISLTATARGVDLAPLAPLVPGSGTKLGGTLDGSIALEGVVGSPRVYGSATLTGGSYVSDLETSPIRAVDAQLRFAGSSIALESLRGTVGRGSVTGSGQLDMPLADAPPSSYAIDLVAKGAQVNVPGYGGGSIDGELRVVSGRRRPVVSGDVTLYDTTIPFATIFKASGSGDADAGPPLDLGLDLHATAGKNVRVKSPIIDVGATGAITLTGSLLTPRASGVLTATRGGVFSTYQRLFRIQDATVTFDPEQGIVPNLDLHATAHVTNPDPDTTRNAIGSADIAVAVTGPADAFTIAFSSEPSYSQAQIVALLAAIPIIGAVNFNQPQVPGTLRGAPGESNVLLPPGVTPYQTGVYTVQQEAFSLLSTQLTQRILSPLENAFGNSLGLTDLQLTLDYGGRVGYTARQLISAKRQISVTLGQVLSYPVRTQVGLTARPDAFTSASFSYFTQNGTPSYQNSIFGSSSTVQVLNGIQPLSNRQGFTAVLTRRYP